MIQVEATRDASGDASVVAAIEPKSTTIRINDEPFLLTIWTPDAWAHETSRCDDARHLGDGVHYRFEPIR